MCVMNQLGQYYHCVKDGYITTLTCEHTLMAVFVAANAILNANSLPYQILLADYYLYELLIIDE